MFLIQSGSRKRTIHLCLHYYTHGGKKLCCYCVIGIDTKAGVSWPIQWHDTMVARCDKETPRNVLEICGRWEIIHTSGSQT